MNDIFKSDDEVLELIGHENNAMVKLKIIGSGNHDNHDRSNKKAGDQVRGPEKQAQIATLAKLVGNKATSELTQVGPTQVSQHKNGKNSNNEVVKELIDDSEARMDILGNKAVDKVQILLDMLDEEKASDLKAKDIPAAAQKMMDVAERIKKRNQVIRDETGAAQPQIHFYAPVQLKIDQYVKKEV
jgi:hypothetical protein